MACEEASKVGSAVRSMLAENAHVSWLAEHANLHKPPLNPPANCMGEKKEANMLSGISLRFWVAREPLLGGSCGGQLVTREPLQANSSGHWQ